MAAIQQWTAWPAESESEPTSPVVRSPRSAPPAGRVARAPRPVAPVRTVSLFAGDGRPRRPRLPARSVPLVAHDDLASLDRRPPRSAPAAHPPVRVPGPQAPRSPAPRRAVRVSPAVYRRRRAVVAALFLGVLLAGGWALGVLGGGSLTASEAGSPAVDAPQELRLQPVSQATYVVEPGDTLWSIAEELTPEGGDVRPVVDALAAHRDGRPLEVGERIVLP